MRETRAFQRLRSVRFLGGIDYVIVRAPNGTRLNVRHTRYEHSVSVANLALQYAALVGLSQAARRLACAVALLHDIGHAPLSHTLEPVFDEAFGINHHQATRDVVTGRAKIGREVKEVLQAFRLDPELILAVLDGDQDPCAGFFGGPINFDTIEGILRTRRYTTRSVSGLTPMRVVMAATNRLSTDDQNVVDHFWDEKNQVYAQIIRSSEGVLSDHLCQTLARRHISRLSRVDFLTTEKALFKKLPEIRDALLLGLGRGIESYNVSAPAEFVARTFFVDWERNFFARDDGRYKQSRSVRSFYNLPMYHDGGRSERVQMEMLAEAAP